MGGGNGQKSKMAREKNLEKQKAAAKGSQLQSNKKAMTIQIKIEDLVKVSFHYVHSCIFLGVETHFIKSIDRSMTWLLFVVRIIVGHASGSSDIISGG
ncbi:hypothetical protein REPUB_Repub01dG0196500 [Reevesia pubescens]